MWVGKRRKREQDKKRRENNEPPPAVVVETFETLTAKLEELLEKEQKVQTQLSDALVEQSPVSAGAEEQEDSLDAFMHGVESDIKVCVPRTH